ncbi:DMT family transporter [Falsiroseomonas sp.]|uniref:DMT family transporter n=1 Tax=Falsiroseomonas sp. TaxID=2870721 RepID=UPI00356A7283
MTPPGAPREQRILLGIGFMILGATILPAMNGIVQWLTPRYPPEQVVWARITGQLLVMVALMLPRAGLRVLATRRPGLQFARSVCQVVSTSLYFVALVTLPLAKAAVIGFIGPFIVALLAWPMLGERLRLARMLAVAAAFVGVLVVIRPGGAAFQPASLMILGSASLMALYHVLTRMVSTHDRAETSVLWSALLGGVVLTLLVPLFWVTPSSVADALAFLALGAFGAGGHYCVARAFGLGPAAVIAPFQYWQIVTAVAIGVVFSGVWPEPATWVGAAIVVAAGVFLAIHEGRR